MKLSLIAAISKNGVIGNGPDIPWSAKGEQLLFKAITYNQWLLIGRKTFESMGALPNRKYAVVTRSDFESIDENVLVFSSITEALNQLEKVTPHVLWSTQAGHFVKHNFQILSVFCRPMWCAVCVSCNNLHMPLRLPALILASGRYYL